MAMTNSGLRAFIDEYGDRICALLMNNNNKIYIGYPSVPIKSGKDIELRTFGDTDMFRIPLEPSDPKLQRKGVQFDAWHVTEQVQFIIIGDENHNQYLYDPFQIR